MTAHERTIKELTRCVNRLTGIMQEEANSRVRDEYARAIAGINDAKDSMVRAEYLDTITQLQK